MNKRILPIAVIALLIFSVASADASIAAIKFSQNHPYISYWLFNLPYIVIALAITLPIEIIVALIFQHLFPNKFNSERLIGLVVLANIISVPLLNIIALFSGKLEIIVTLEIIATLFEAYFIYISSQIKFKDSLILSIAMNSASFLVGLVILFTFG